MGEGGLPGVGGTWADRSEQDERCVRQEKLWGGWW